MKTHKTIFSIASILFGCLLCTILSAQDTIPERLNARKLLRTEGFSPFGSSALQNGVSNISFSSSLDSGQNGKIEIKVNNKDSTAIWGLSADQKIDKSKSEAVPFDLLGISPETTVELSLQKMFWHPSLNVRGQKKLSTLLDDYAQRNNVDRRTLTLNVVRKNGNADERRQAAHINTQGAFFINGKLSFTKNSYSYVLDSVSLAENKVSHLIPGVTVSCGKIMVGRHGNISYLSILYRYTVQYNEGDNLSLFVPFGTSGNYVSKDVTFGAPVKKSDHIVSCEWRTNILLNSNSVVNSIAFAPSLNYSSANNDVAVLLPVYFINGVNSKGKPQGLQGGIRFSYLTPVDQKMVSFKDGFNIQLFIAAPFSLL